MGLQSPKYPEVYDESDSCAIDYQKKYFGLFKVKIGLLIAVSVIASVSTSRIAGFEGLGIATAGILLFLTALTVIIDLRRYDRIWFNARAIAETVKKESWLFMMKIKPYDDSVSEGTAITTLLNNFREIVGSQQSVSAELSKHLKDSPQVTDQMRIIRNATFAERLKYYTTYRIHDQRLWYAKKSNLNRTQESLWFVMTWIFQFLAVFFAFVLFLSNNSIINPVGILTTTAAAVISWTGARSYRELSQSYGLITHELSFLEERANQLSTESDLGEIVQDVERTISREHTIWLARRITS